MESRHTTSLQLIEINEPMSYFQTLLTEDRGDFSEDEGLEHSNTGLQITLEEDEDVLKKGKNDKAPGPRRIPMELLKYGGEKFTKVLTALMISIFQGDTMPNEMKLGYITPIYKKGDRRNCSNYRGICVTNPIMKILGRLIRNRLELEFKGMEEQCGFTSGRSCVDHIFTLRQILEKYNAKSKQTGLVFVGLQKAYDSGPRKMLWKALEITSISEPLIHTIKETHEGNRCQIKIGTSLSQAFYTSKGVLQGCSMSPTPFKVFVEASLNEWSRMQQYGNTN
jgi:hypothetical protein